MIQILPGIFVAKNKVSELITMNEDSSGQPIGRYFRIKMDNGNQYIIDDARVFIKLGGKL